MSPTTCTRVGAILAGIGVGLGAFGAHGLEPILTERETLDTWDTAVLYHLIHAVALVLCGMTAEARSQRIAAASFAIGIAVFSGSLYVLATTGPRWLGAITPIGGVAFLVGWGALAFGGHRPPSP